MPEPIVPSPSIAIFSATGSSPLLCSGQRTRAHQPVRILRLYINGVAQGASESLISHFHPIAVAKDKPVAEKMNMHASGLTMPFEFEVMMFKIRETVAHIRFSRGHSFRPYRLRPAQ